MAQAFRRTIANGIAVTKTWPDGQVLSTLVHVQEGEIATWQKRGNPHLDEDGQVAIDEEGADQRADHAVSGGPGGPSPLGAF